jgi:hypothetical protein
VRRPRALRQFPACYRADAAATGAEELLEVPLPPPLDGVEPPLDDAELEPEEDEPEEDEPEEPESEPPPLEPPSFLVEL